MHQHGEETCNHPVGKWAALEHELRQHLPFSVSCSALGLTFAGLISYLAPVAPHHVHADHPGESSMYALFHLFHPAHMFFSAAATTAMFWRYERRWAKAIVIGLIGSMGVCGLSDIVLPQVSLMFMGVRGPWHICIWDHPGIVIPFAATGVFVGFVASSDVVRSTLFSHSLHVLVSTAATVFYLIVPFEPLAWIDSLGQIFLFVVLGVVGPCCFSDIIFPLLMRREARTRALADHLHPH